MQEFHAHLTSFNPHKQFISEVESDNCLSFKTLQQLEQTVAYRSTCTESRHTDKYLDLNFHHPAQHKRSLVNTLLDRAEKIPSTNRGKRKEKQHVIKVLMNNDYPLQFINTNNTANEVTTPFVVLPYVKGVTERVSKVLRHNGVKVGFKPLSTLGTIVSRPKEKHQPCFSLDA